MSDEHIFSSYNVPSLRQGHLIPYIKTCTTSHNFTQESSVKIVISCYYALKWEHTC